MECNTCRNSGQNKTTKEVATSATSFVVLFRSYLVTP